MGEMKEKRPNPDEILERLSKAARGKLTVFLGAAAGVGKTFTMLETAHERLREGARVTIGWVETHGRQETENLVAGLPRIPARVFEYRGKKLREMDIDAILEQKPEIVLVDELAHTNIPGSRRVRRFQDVEELLKAGINVYTTLNIQHIESLNDVVAQITGVVVRETVPDYIIEQADTVQLIDIPPEDLIKRLKEGKVYIPDQAQRALKNFFRPGNINALRELALRFTASSVDKEMCEYMRGHHIEGPWPTAGRVMVCVGASPFSTQLIRAARRLADGLRAEWLAVHIDTAKRAFPIGEKERDRLARNMQLAEELGAKTLQATAEDLTGEILEIARAQNVTAIVIGKPRHGRLREWLNGSVVDKLISKSGGINIYVIQATAEKEVKPKVSTSPPVIVVKWSHYGLGLAMTAAVTAFGILFREKIELLNIALLYQLPVTFTAFWWGSRPSYFAAVCSVLAFDFLFVPPTLTLNVTDVRYIWSFITFLIVAFVIGRRTEMLREEASSAKLREKSIRALYEFSRGIAAVVDMERIAEVLVRHVADTLNRKVLVFLPDSKGKLRVVDAHESEGTARKENKKTDIDDAELAVASWAFEHAEAAGRSTDTIPGAGNLYLPLIAKDRVVGVLGIHVVEKRITPAQRRLMEAWAGLAAIAFERVNLTEKAREAALLVEADRLRTALFSSISHDLRTPLSYIIGSASTLVEAENVYTAEQRRELLEAIKDGAARMERLVSNLLDTARLESGILQLKNDWCDVEDIIGSALRRLGDAASQRKINVCVPEMALIRGDCVLLEQVVINLMDNALKYNAFDKTVDLLVSCKDNKVKVTIADQGCGIPEEELPFIFDKFYRVKHPGRVVSGTGLGLSICKGIVEAHGGEIWAENRTGGGLLVSFTLPAASRDQQPPLPERGDEE